VDDGALQTVYDVNEGTSAPQAEDTQLDVVHDCASCYGKLSLCGMVNPLYTTNSTNSIYRCHKKQGGNLSKSPCNKERGIPRSGGYPKEGS
jgi:hypothetical protein